MKLLDIKNLKVMFLTGAGLVRAVEGIDLYINEAESVAIVGESGCGKSVTSLAAMKLLPSPPALIRADRLVISRSAGETDILNASETEMQKIRGNDMSMIFQDPISALNPVLTVGRQIDEVFIAHKGMSAKQAKAATISLLKEIGVTAAERRYAQFPHELSGASTKGCLLPSQRHVRRG